jgi:hypothetical protein
MNRDRRHHQNSKQDHPLRERWEVANGPWRVKQNKPSPRERKRRQQAARRRDKEQQTTYWLRSRGEPRGKYSSRSLNCFPHGHFIHEYPSTFFLIQKTVETPT